MNKDVIYVEPEDDITDIILKIENSKEKIVALVPPKKAGVFRSVVNIKLISKSGASANKKIVLVTTDPSILRLAASAKIPVTKNLQTPPTIPSVTDEEDQTSKETLVEESDGTVETEEDVEELKDDKKDKEPEEKDEDEEDEDEDDEKDKEDTKNREDKKEKTSKKDSGDDRQKNEKRPKNGNKITSWIKDHKKLTIAGCVGIVLLILGLVWAFTIAPAVKVTVGVKATSNNFSEAVTFTDKMSEENAAEGKFYLEEKKVEDIKEIEFEATGKKNIGKKATGEISVYAYFPLNVKASTPIAEGTLFTISGLSYRATKSLTLSYSGEGKSECANKDNSEGLVDYGCRVNGIVPVEATEPGSKYNIEASSTGWDTNARVFPLSEKPMSGGTDEELTVVQQSDVVKAKESLEASNEAANKEKLLSTVDSSTLVLESTFKQAATETITTPGVDEEVKDGVKPKLKAVTTATVYVVDKTKLEEFIRTKAQLSDNQKIFEMKDPFIENLSQSTTGYVGKLKTTYLTGPKISVSSVVDMIKGKGIGDAQHSLKDIDGVTDVKINTSFPWVMSVPNDSNKITVDITVKDQTGAEVKLKDEKEDEKTQDDKKTEDDDKDAEKKEEKKE